MAQLNITITTVNDDVFPIQVSADDSVSKLKDMVEMITQIAPAQQVLMHNGKPLPAAATLAAAGLADGDLVFVMPQSSAPAPSAPTPQQAMALNPDGSAANPRAFIDAIRQNTALMNQARQMNQTLADAVQNGDVDTLQRLLRQVKQAQDAAAAEEALPEDPLDPEYQRKMYERIQKQNIEENMMQALEHTPEVFGQVEMLYVDMAVNGEPVKAFIDSGAQMTIMTQACAEKCNIIRLVDKRFAGMAVGVGSSKIVGRIHTCAVKVGSQHVASSVTVLEQKDGPQFIFGLDNLKRHHCSINLKRNVLEIGTCDVELPFLPEHLVPKDFNERRQRPEGAAEELDAAGTMPQAVQGDPAAARPTSAAGAAPSQTAQAAAPGPTAAAAAAGSAPAAGSSAAVAGAGGAASLARQLQEITGADLEQCEKALQLCGGNIDAAAGHLLGF